MRRQGVSTTYHGGGEEGSVPLGLQWHWALILFTATPGRPCTHLIHTPSIRKWENNFTYRSKNFLSFLFEVYPTWVSWRHCLFSIARFLIFNCILICICILRGGSSLLHEDFLPIPTTLTGFGWTLNPSNWLLGVGNSVPLQPNT